MKPPRIPPLSDDVVTAFETLRDWGVQGLEHLCLPSEAFIPKYTSTTWDLPLCADSSTLQQRMLVEATGEIEVEDEGMDSFTFNVIGSAITVVAIAAAAGLFLGLMTLDVLDLQIIVRSSVDEDEVKYAKRMLPIIKDRHRLLVTLLLMDTLAYETLPIFLDQLMSGWMAVLWSTTLVMIFGEVFPSGIFTGPNQLYLVYHLAPVVEFFLTLLYPVAKPLGLLLDWLVNEDEEDQWYDRGELTALVRIQHEERTRHYALTSKTGQRRLTKVIKYVRHNDRHWNDLKAEIIESVKEREAEHEGVGEEAAAALDQLTPPLHQREIDMVEGALNMKTKLAMDVYTPLKHIYAVPDDLVLDKTSITTIYSRGFSRVPVYRRNPDDEDDITAITGYLLTRQLMLVDWDHKRTLDTLPLTRPTCVSPRMNLVDLLRLLQTQGPVLTFVCARPDLANRALKAEKPIPVEAGLIGIISLVDIMESVLQDRIYDEFDIRDRDKAVHTLQTWAAEMLQSFVRRRRRGSLRSSSPKRRLPTVVAAALESAEVPNLSADESAPTENTPLLSASSGDASGDTFPDASELV